MKILLIKPPYTRLKGMGQSPYFPLGLGYVASILRQDGHEAVIYHAENARDERDHMLIDAELTYHHRSLSERRYHEAMRDQDYYVWREVSDTLQSFKPDIVGLTLLSVETASAYKVSQLCKQYRADLPVVWGGLHPSFMSQECLQLDAVDFVVRGEGEETMRELCRMLGEGQTHFEKVPGLSFKRDGVIQHNETRPPIENLDTIPMPARDANLYEDTFDFKSLGSMIISRGCPFRCTFCSSRNFWDKKVRFRSPESMLNEIRYLQKNYGTNHIMFWDDTLTINRKTVTRYCEALIEAGLKVNWKAATRADLMHEDILSMMKKAGCVKLEIGVESGSDRIKKLIYKDVTNEQIKKAFQLINAKGIGSGAFFMAGFPEETMEDLEQTYALMRELDATEMAFNIFDPMPGSDEYDKCIQYGLLDEHPDWTDFKFWPDAHYVRDIAPDEFTAKANEIAAWLYRRNNSLRYKFRRNKQYIQYLLLNDPAFLAKKTAGFVKRRLHVKRQIKERA